jgi:hypothetical protein
MNINYISFNHSTKKKLKIFPQNHSSVRIIVLCKKSNVEEKEEILIE